MMPISSVFSGIIHIRKRIFQCLNKVSFLIIYWPIHIQCEFQICCISHAQFLNDKNYCRVTKILQQKITEISGTFVEEWMLHCHPLDFTGSTHPNNIF